MLNAKETQKILVKFFQECFHYWRGNAYSAHGAFELAIKDIEGIKHDPYSPLGEELHPEAKEDFINKRKEELRRS